MLNGLRFLVVEDDELNAMLCEEQLLSHGAGEIKRCDSVASTMDALDQHPFDAAVVDFRLNDEDSTSILDRLEEMRIPRVLVTGGTFDPIPRRFAHIRVLTKPYSCDALLHAVAASMQRLLDGKLIMARRARQQDARRNPELPRGSVAVALNEDLSEAK